MSSEKINKYFIFFMKVLFSLVTLLTAYLMYKFSKIFIVYDYKKINYDFIIILIILFGLYLYILTFITILTALFKRFNKLRSYIIFFIPFIPILFLSLWIYQSREFSDTDFILLSNLYVPFFIFTLFFVTKRSYGIIRYIVGKKIVDNEDDYSFISVFSKYPYGEGNVISLIKDVITNFLSYKLVDVDVIYFNGKKYKVWNYGRKNRYNNWHIENILLTELYIKTTDFENPPPIEKDHEDKEYNYEDKYMCIYIQQLYDDGDEISVLPSIFDDIYLAIKKILPEDTLIYYHKDEDITPSSTPSSIWALRSNLFDKFLVLKYGTLLDKAEIKIKDIFQQLKEPYKKALKYSFYLILLLIIIIYLYINKYFPILNTETILLVILGFPPFIYYSIKIYERYVLKKKE